MTSLVAAVDFMIADLKELEYDGQPLRVTPRLEDVQPPCVWVALESIDHLSAVGEMTLRLFLIAPAMDEYRALKVLGPLLDQVLTVVSPTEATTVVGISPTNQLRDLAALRVTTTVVT
ncbi:hypothetical protein [Aeromicrobium fastidiosum]|uniref:DUF3168 domain-containing protein n=1 Tax=Aeromicrobium fastidiosum TaxID=52699 RepID=A0A641ARF3_9ACTN|nr:hypothetical protein [Aeromicrobium fastidiosum]KAA1380519.1 hypothetical protein ESP62_004905 [Aeromicrobium fastidiosum]MBP2390111.1 hypothetical protein [Aeromicrobium fastidiosum]